MPRARSRRVTMKEMDHPPMTMTRDRMYISVMVLAAGAGAWFVRGLVEIKPAGSMDLLLPGAILGAVSLPGLYLRFRRRRCVPRLEALSRQAWSGDAPIEELNRFQGHLRPLALLIAGILHDLRQQRTAVAELNAETQQRIAQRTHALERQLGSLRQQAARDKLTGLYNRRMLDHFLGELVGQCRNGDRRLCLLMMDVDHFKLLNDTLGHAAGDALLRSIGQIIRSAVREQDLAFRYGGDEFVILLPDAGVEEGEDLSQRLILTVDALARPLRLSRRLRLSIGLSLYRASDACTPELLLQQADASLYERKLDRPSPAAVAL